jgi:hypothetical protein
MRTSGSKAALERKQLLVSLSIPKFVRACRNADELRFRTLVDRNADPRVTQWPHATVKEFSITPIQTPKRSRLGRSGEKDHAS